MSKKNIPQMPSLQNTMYIDANRQQSVANEEDNSEWTYKLNQGIKLPAGTQIQVINALLNYNGIQNGSIEINEDVNETLSYCFYDTQGSRFSLSAEKSVDENAGRTNSKNGVFVYDAQKHRNMNNVKAPLVRRIFDPNYPGEEPQFQNSTTQKLWYIRTIIQRYDLVSNQQADPSTFYGTTGFPTNFIQNVVPEIVYSEYFDQITSTGTTNRYDLNADVIIKLEVQARGTLYAEGDRIIFTGGGATTPAFGFVSEVDGTGAIQQARLIQVGEGYTSDPTISITTTSGTGANITLTRGAAVSARTNNSGYGIRVGVTVGPPDPNLHEIEAVSILATGTGYRDGDILYLDNGLAPLNFYPTNHDSVIQHTNTSLSPRESQATVSFTNASDIQSPGVLTCSQTEEQIQYLRASSVSNSTGETYKEDFDTEENGVITFIYDDNEEFFNDGYVYNVNKGGYSDNPYYLINDVAEENIQYRMPRNYDYEIELAQLPAVVHLEYPTTSTPGAGYNGIPDVVYSPSGYSERYLNTGDYNEPSFRAVVNESNEIEKVVYLPGSRDDLSASNYLTELKMAQDLSRDTQFCPPGDLSITGGNPTTQANARFSRNTVRKDGFDYSFYFRKKKLKRYFQQGRPLALDYSVVVLNPGTNYSTGTYSLVGIEGAQGTGASVVITKGYAGLASGVLTCKVTVAGDSYKVGERYRINEEAVSVENQAVVQVLEVQPNNNPIPANQENVYYSVFFRPNDVENGIAEISKNSISKNVIFDGKTKTLPGDALTVNESLIEFGDRTALSDVRNFSYFNGICDLNSVKSTGGTNDLIGYCEFDEDGYLNPVIVQKTLSIPKGIYSISEVSDLITDQLTNATQKKDFLSESAFSRKIETHLYEPARFTGKEHNHAGRGVFVSMSVFNDLMEKKRDGETLPTEYLWENFHRDYYYSFIRVMIPSGKPPFRLWAGLMKPAINDEPGFTVQNTNIPYDSTSVYDMMSDGVLIGTSDFNIDYNPNKSTFTLNLLHTPFRNPSFDKYGNIFSDPGQVGALLRKRIKGSGVEGVNQQYNYVQGYEGRTPQGILDKLDTPITRETGVMIYNFSKNISDSEGNITLSSPAHGKFEDNFSSAEVAQESWKKTFFSRLGFTYTQLNGDTNKETVNYYDLPTTTTLYGITTDQSLDSSVITSISTLYANNIRNDAGQTGEGGIQQLFTLMNPSISRVPVYNAAKYYVRSNSQAGGGSKPDVDNNKFYTGGFYDASNCHFVQTGGDDLTAAELPILIKDGYFIITSDIVDAWRDSVKKGELIPLLAVVPKSNWQSQDFSNISFSDISHTLSNPKVINQIKIKVYNPDLSSPLLRPDSTVMLKITLPPEQPTTEED
jgi:hypothetical protein